MPKYGEKFINAVGREVKAHGGTTPSAPSRLPEEPVRVQAAGVTDFDVFGREYDIAVPAFLTTGTGMVYDRIAMTTGSRGGSPFGMLIDAQSLLDYGEAKGYDFPPHEVGMPPLWWEQANRPGVDLAPGFSTANVVMTGSSDTPTRIVGPGVPAESVPLHAQFDAYIPAPLDPTNGPFLLMGRVLNFVGTSVDNMAWQVRIHTDGALRFHLTDGAGSPAIISTDAYPLDQWFRIYAQYDGTEAKLSVDGVNRGELVTAYAPADIDEYRFLDTTAGQGATNIQLRNVTVVEGNERPVSFSSGYDNLTEDDNILRNAGSWGDGIMADSWVAPQGMVPPLISVPDMTLPETSPTLDLMLYTRGYATSWTAEGANVASVNGSVVTFATGTSSETVAFAAINPSGQNTDTATIAVQAAPVLTTPPRIDGFVGPSRTLTLIQPPEWDGTSLTTTQVWRLNGAETGVVGDTYTVPANIDVDDVIDVYVTATDDLGQLVDRASNSLVMVPPQLEIPPEFLVEGDTTIDLAEYSAGYITSYGASGDGVAGINGSVVTIIDAEGEYTILCTASNPAGTTEASATVRVVPENIYVNAALVGGAASGPSDGSNPPTNHTIGFNTINSYPVDNGDGTFNWRINDEGDLGRSYLTYALAENHPLMQPGDRITVSWKVRDLTNTRTITLSNSVGSLNNVDLEYTQQFTSPDQKVTLAATATITGLPFECQFRIGTGPTTNRQENLIISEPIAFYEDLVTYDPIDGDPLWTPTGATNWYSNSMREVFCRSGTNNDIPVIFNGLTDVQNAEASCHYMVMTSNDGISSFYPALRITDGNNFVGVRTHNGEIETYERVAGAWNQLGSVAQPAVGTRIALSVVGTDLTLTVGQDTYNYTTAITDPGGVGAVARGRTYGGIMFQNFAATAL